MSKTIFAADVIQIMERQQQILILKHDEDETIRSALQTIFEETRNLVGSRELHSENDLNLLCAEFTTLLDRFLPRGKKKPSEGISLIANSILAKALRDSIDDARKKVAEILKSKAGWTIDKISAARAAAERDLGVNLGTDTSAKTEQEIINEMSAAERSALKGMIDDWHLDHGLLHHLLADLYPGRFQEADGEEVDSLARLVGKATPPPARGVLPNLPSNILTLPKAAWFREVMFNARRDQLLPVFAKQGFEPVEHEIAEDIKAISECEAERLKETQGDAAQLAVRQEFALKRRVANALLAYFEGIECQESAPGLVTQIRGLPFPDRQQKTAAFETLKFGGRLYNEGGTGSGKTGAGIYTLALAMHRGLINGALIEAPASTHGEWQQALSDEAGSGYFQEGALAYGDVVFINGTPEERPVQWEMAKTAKWTVIGTEMARQDTQVAKADGTGTEWISHRELLMRLQKGGYLMDEAHKVRNTSKKETSAILNFEEPSNGDSLTSQQLVEQQESDMVRSYDVARCSDIRILMSATVMPSKLMDLVGPTIMLNTPKAAGIPSSREHWGQRLQLFEKFLADHGMKEDAETLATLPVQKAQDCQEWDWDDRAQLRADVAKRGRQIPRTFLPHRYKPPREACVDTPPCPVPVIVRIPSSIQEEAVTEEVRQQDGALFHKMQTMNRVHLHPYGTANHPETGETMSAEVRKLIDARFAEGVRHIVIASPIYKTGFTQPTKHHPTDCMLERLKQIYPDVEFFALDGDSTGNRERKVSPISNRLLTKSQANIEQFAHTEKQSIQLVQMDTVGVGINEYARQGISNVICVGHDWLLEKMRQFYGRFPRPQQTNEVWIALVLVGDFLNAMEDAAVVKHRENSTFLNGRIPSQTQLRLFNEQPSKQPLASMARTEREEFSDLCRLMAADGGRMFITRDEHVERFRELYNRNWEESFNGNTLRLIAGMVQQRLPALQKARSKRTGIPNDPVRIADDAAGTFGLHRSMVHVPGVEIHTSDYSEKMMDEMLGRALLKDQYNEKNIHPCLVYDTPYENESMDMRVTSLVFDVLKHGERPRKAGRELIKTFLESNRIQPMGGQWIATIPTSIFEGNTRARAQFLKAFPYFGYKIIEGTGRARGTEVLEGDDPFKVDVFIMEKCDPPAITADMPWDQLPDEVRQGLDFRRCRKQKKAGKKKKSKGSSKEDKGSYNDSFVVEPFDSTQSEQTVMYGGSDEEKNKKQEIRNKRKMLEHCTNAVRVVMRGYLTTTDVPKERWLKLRLDDVLTDDQHPQHTPHQVLNTYMEAVLETVKNDNTLQSSIDRLNAGQKKGQIVCKEDSEGVYLLYANPSGATSGKKYRLPKIES